MSAIVGTGTTLDAGVPIAADDGSIARILGKRPVLWVGADQKPVILIVSAINWSVLRAM